MTGSPGVGKSHLAIGLALKAIERGYRVLFTTAAALMSTLTKALSEGRDVFTRVAVVADTQDPTPPCGSCRQLLWEYCGDIEVVIANLTEVKRRIRLSELLPLPFDAHLLKEKT